MKKKATLIWLAFATMAGAVSGKDAGWSHYGADAKGPRYSTARQIHRGNVGQLEIAWIFRTGETGEGYRFANSPVALRATTGEIVWHFQLVHHDLWDYDLAAQPTLIEWQRDSETVPTVVQATRQGMLFAFHRQTGEPLFPVEERPVPQLAVARGQATPMT